MSGIGKAVKEYIKSGDNVALTQSLKTAFYEKVGENPDFQAFAQKLEQYKEKKKED